MAIKFVIWPTSIEEAGNRNAWRKKIMVMDVMQFKWIMYQRITIKLVM